MTHDQLLKKINTQRFVQMHELVIRTNAIRAVVELHKPEIRYSDVVLCSVCYTEGEPYEIAADVCYPCPTIQAIEKELT
jgi:hypothetical protein